MILNHVNRSTDKQTQTVSHYLSFESAPGELYDLKFVEITEDQFSQILSIMGCDRLRVANSFDTKIEWMELG